MCGCNSNKNKTLPRTVVAMPNRVVSSARAIVAARQVSRSLPGAQKSLVARKVRVAVRPSRR